MHTKPGWGFKARLLETGFRKTLQDSCGGSGRFSCRPVSLHAARGPLELKAWAQLQRPEGTVISLGILFLVIIEP